MNQNILNLLGAIGGVGGLISAFFTAYQYIKHGPDILLDNSWIKKNSVETKFEAYANVEQEYGIFNANIPFLVINNGSSGTTLVDAKIDFEYVGIGEKNFLNLSLPHPRAEWQNPHSFPIFKPQSATIRMTEFNLWLPRKEFKVPTRAKICLRLRFLGQREKRLWYILDSQTKNAWGCKKNDSATMPIGMKSLYLLNLSYRSIKPNPEIYG